MAEEVTQDVFLAALESTPNSGPVSVEWLYRVARNRMIDVLRRQHNYETKLRLVANSDGVARDSEHRVVDRIQLEEVLAELSSSHRSVLMLRYIDGLSVKDLASSFRRSERGIEALLMRARAAFREALEATDD